MASSEEKQHSPVPYFDQQYTPRENFKIFVGIDFGTDGSGLAYSLQDGSTYIHNLWKDVSSVEKPKTSVLFDNFGEVQCHGNQAVIQYISSMSNDGWKLFERFKMKLYDNNPKWKKKIVNQHNNKFMQKVDLHETITSTNNNLIKENSETVFVAQLKFLKNEAMTFITRNFKRKKKIKFNQDEIQWILTVPAIWSDKAKQRMKDWAVKAGLIEGHIPNQLKIVYEPDCASLSIQHALLRNLQQQNLLSGDEKDYQTDEDLLSVTKAMSDSNGPRSSLSGASFNAPKSMRKKNILQPHRPQISIDVPFKKGDKYVLLDVGGGTCDCACHEIMGEFAIAEVLHPSGGPWGACNIDKEFELMLDDIFSKAWMNEFRQHSPNMYQQLLQNFIGFSKVSFYDYVKVKNKSYNDDENDPRTFHDVTLPSNFGDFLIDKLEETQDIEDDDIDAEELLDNYLEKRCRELYKNGKLITMKELSTSAYVLSLHFDLWKKLFNIVVDPIIDHLDRILENKAMKSCKYIFLVGGFSNAKYLQERIKYQFGDRIQIVIPQLPQLCVVDGAARYGLRPNFMKVRRLAKSYGIQTNKSLASLKNYLHLFPISYIEENTYFDKELQQDYVKQCFCVFGVKSKAISIDDKPIRKAVYKMTKDQKKMMIEIFQSNKIKPMTTTVEDGSKRIGKLVIDLPDSDEYKVWVEFKYSDTMLTVHAYPNGRRDLKIESIVQYN